MLSFSNVARIFLDTYVGIARINSVIASTIFEKLDEGSFEYLILILILNNYNISIVKEAVEKALAENMIKYLLTS